MVLSAEEFIEKKKTEIGKKIKIGDIKRVGHRMYCVEAATYMKASDLDKKVFCFERLRLKSMTDKKDLAYGVGELDDIEYRIGYYIVGQIGNKLNKWTWGQYTPMISKNDLDKLLKKAIDEKTYI